MTWMQLSSLVIGLLESVAFHLNNTILRLFHDILLTFSLPYMTEISFVIRQ